MGGFLFGFGGRGRNCGRMDEEQQMEIEALEAIYLDDLEIISADPPRDLCIRVVPVYGEDDPDGMSLKMQVQLPEDYPQVIPLISLEPLNSITNQECIKLTEQLNSLAEENIGCGMIFTLASFIQEWMVETQNSERQEEEEEPEEQAAPVGKHGTPVTKESFLEWKAMFDEQRLKNNPVKDNEGKKKLEDKCLNKENISKLINLIHHLEMISKIKRI